VIHVRRQVKIIRGKQVLAPLKNDKVHDVPLTDDAVVMLLQYIRTWLREMITLPWIKASCELATFRLCCHVGLACRCTARWSTTGGKPR
jgi:hypothetical protein